MTDSFENDRLKEGPAAAASPATAPPAKPEGGVLAARLTDPQREAVATIDGPMLVLAGPGSGKTRTITHRIAYMLERGIKPWRILAITFTNKASREMAERVEQLAPGSRVWVSTFHRFCARLLRQRAAAVGLESNYSIIGTADQRRLIGDCLSELDFDASHYGPDKILSAISNAKNDLLTPERFAAKFSEQIADHQQAVVAKVYPLYQKRMLEANSVDFDDLLMHVALMLEENDELRAELGERHRFIMVDEYQDTNDAQYRIVAALAERHRNLCVTGDPDQSIYGWRGAKIANILNFERDFPEAKVVRLEQNFRSTKAILACADALIANNSRRKAKVLTTENPDGVEVRVVRYDDGVAEADGIASEIADAVKSGRRRYGDFAVFYRVNSLTQQLELALSRHRVPVQIAQGAKFLDRAEVRDLIGYLRLIANPEDRTAFLRVVNRPQRRLGDTSQRRLADWADLNGLSLLDAAGRADECDSLSKPAKRGFVMFAKMIESLSLAASGSMERLVQEVLERTGYLIHHRAKLSAGGPEADKASTVVGNVEEIVSTAAGYDRRHPEDATLEGFLEETALTGDADAIDESLGQVAMMTLHAAKGLEFPSVYLVGLEQGLLPHERSIRSDDPGELEEERRLLFVGITRAEEELTITRTAARASRGRTQITIDSAFLPELQAERIDATEPLKIRDRDDDESNDVEWDEPSIDVDSGDRTPSQPSASHSASQPRQGRLLQTALPTKSKPAAREAVGFREGMRVRHPEYGTGEVIAVDTTGRLPTVQVQFAEERLRFVAGMAPLQPAELN